MINSLGCYPIERGLTHTGERWERVLLDDGRVLIHRIVEAPDSGWYISLKDPELQRFFRTNKGLIVRDVARILCSHPLDFYPELKSLAFELWSEAEVIAALSDYYECCHDEWKALLPSVSIKYTVSLWDFLKSMTSEHTDCGIVFRLEDYSITGELLIHSTLRVIYEPRGQALVFIYHDDCDYGDIRVEVVRNVWEFTQLLSDEDGMPLDEVFSKCSKYAMLKAGVAQEAKND